MTEPLFSKEPIDHYFSQKRQDLEAEVSRMSEDALLETDEQEITDYLVDKYAIQCPVLRVEDADMDRAMAPLRLNPVLDFGRRGSSQVEAPRYEVAVPYEGDVHVFSLTPNPVSVSGPMPDVVVHPGRILITWHQPAEAASAEQIKAWIDQQIASVNGFLRQSQANIDAFNGQLAGIAHRAITTRRAKMQAFRDVAGVLGFPLKRRGDAADFEVPLKRRVLTSLPKPSAPAPAKREYRLGDADYEAALSVLEHQRNGLERSPSLTSRLNEEQIRLILLIGLNAVFEGQAFGEVFNAAGKTDILIRSGDANVFVAECKIWDGPAVVTAALGQLLSYLTWRDTKGALVLFIRNANVTAVIGKAVAAIEAHPCFVRTLPPADGSARRDFILHAEGDDNQLLRLAFMPFALGETAAKQAR